MSIDKFDTKLGDCFDVMRDYPDHSVDMILCDLPYGVTRNRWDSELNLESLWCEYERIIRSNGAICLHADGLFMAKLMMSRPNLWRYNLVWDKVLTTGFLNANKMPLRRTEEICVFYKNLPTYHPQKTTGAMNHAKGRATGLNADQSYLRNHNYGAYVQVDNGVKLGNQKHPTSLLTFSKPHPSKAFHPTEKPVALLEWLIRTYTNPGDVVLDNCMGSGSTGVACANTGRRFIGIEKDPKYFKIAEDRITAALMARNDIDATKGATL